MASVERNSHSEPCPCGDWWVTTETLESMHNYSTGVFSTTVSLCCDACRELYVNTWPSRDRIVLERREDVARRQPFKDRYKAALGKRRREVLRPAAGALLVQVKAGSRSMKQWAVAATRLLGRPLDEQTLRQEVGRYWDSWADQQVRSGDAALIGRLQPDLLEPLLQLNAEVAQMEQALEQCRLSEDLPWWYPGRERRRNS